MQGGNQVSAAITRPSAGRILGPIYRLAYGPGLHRLVRCDTKQGSDGRSHKRFEAEPGAGTDAGGGAQPGDAELLPRYTLKSDNTFLRADALGDIHSADDGLFTDDTPGCCPVLSS